MANPLHDNPRSKEVAGESASSYDTKLSPKKEAEYQTWVKEQSKKQGRSIESSDYDMRGFFNDSKSEKGDNGHYPDTYKKPSHPTFSDESKYHGVDGNEGGKWKRGEGNKWTFTPGKTNVENGLDKTQEYLQQSDPDVTLAAPEE